MLWRQTRPHLADVGHDLVQMAAAALRQVVFVEARHRTEMLADPRERLGEVDPRRKVLGEQVLEVAKKRARLRIALETLPLCLALTAVRKALERVETLVDCHPVLVRKRRRRHLGRLQPFMFSGKRQSATRVRSAGAKR